MFKYANLCEAWMLRNIKLLTVEPKGRQEDITQEEENMFDLNPEHIRHLMCLREETFLPWLAFYDF